MRTWPFASTVNSDAVKPTLSDSDEPSSNARTLAGHSSNTVCSSGRAALSFVCDAAFYQVQLRVAPLPRVDGDASGLVYLLGSIDTAEAQSVRYARLTGGITFELQGEGSAVLERWEQQVEQLKRAAAASSR